MEFEELLLEEIIAIVKETKEENFMRIDLKRLLSHRLEEYGNTVEADCYRCSEEDCDSAYENGYADGWNDAREEIQELAKDMRRYN